MKNRISPLILIFILFVIGCNSEKIIEKVQEFAPQSDEPEGAMHFYMKSACEGKIEEASLSFSENLRKNPELLREGLKVFETLCKEKGGFKQLDILSTKTKNDKESSVNGKLVLKNGDIVPVEHQISRENGKWKIINPFKR